VKRLLTIAAVALGLLAGAAHAKERMTEDERQAAASDQGYTTAAPEKLCSDVLLVSDPKLRAKMDRQYRDNDKYRKSYSNGYAYVVDEARHQQRAALCAGAAHSSYAKWVKYAPGGAEKLNAEEIEARKAHPEDPNHLMGNALNHVIENVTTKRGETCKRIGNGTIAQCTLFKSSEYWAMYVEMPIAMVKAMSPLGRSNAAKEGCAKINENKKDKFESYTSNYLISDDGVVLNCTYHAVGK
jgi:hypothetical protein